MQQERSHICTLSQCMSSFLTSSTFKRFSTITTSVGIPCLFRLTSCESCLWHVPDIGPKVYTAGFLGPPQLQFLHRGKLLELFVTCPRYIRCIGLRCFFSGPPQLQVTHCGKLLVSRYKFDLLNEKYMFDLLKNINLT